VSDRDLLERFLREGGDAPRFSGPQAEYYRREVEKLRAGQYLISSELHELVKALVAEVLELHARIDGLQRQLEKLRAG
jgi:hypothetical protein